MTRTNVFFYAKLWFNCGHKSSFANAIALSSGQPLPLQQSIEKKPSFSHNYSINW